MDHSEFILINGLKIVSIYKGRFKRYINLIIQDKMDTLSLRI